MNSQWLRITLSIFLAIGLTHWGGRDAQATFQPGYERPGFDNWPEDLVAFDDGSGERLFAVGRFRVAEDVEVTRIAAWDGSRWSALPGPSGAVGLNAPANALAVFDDGSGAALYVGGSFTTAGGVPANRIARWDGATWSALGTGLDNSVNDLIVFDDGTGPALYAGGWFDTAGGVSSPAIARWDGQTWSAVPGLDAASRVTAFAVHDDGSGSGPALITAGAFATVDGLVANNIARWDGSAWSALGAPGSEGITGTVEALASYDPGSGPELFVGGQIQAAGGVPSRHLVRFDGIWSSAPVGQDDPDGLIHALEVFDLGDGPKLFVGSFLRFDENVRLTTFDGTNWSSPIGEQPGNGGIYALEIFDGPSGPTLVAGGEFDSAGDRAMSYIASIEKGELEPLVAGPNLGMSGGNSASVRFVVDEFAVFDAGQGPEIYAGGPLNAGRAVVDGLARLRGGEWAPVVDISGRRLANGLDVNYVLMTYDDGVSETLIVAGDILAGPGATGASEVLQWDGTDWTELGDLTGDITDVAAFDDGSGLALYVGGALSFTGASEGAQLARWDGAHWIEIATDLEGALLALEAHDGALYVGGSKSMTEGEILHRWDGISWSGFAAFDNAPSLPEIYDIHFIDMGTGPVLHVAGDFRSSAGIILNDVARWDALAEQWQPLGAGLNGGVGSGVEGLVLRESGGFLYLGGFGNFGTGFTGIVERWTGSQWLPLSAQPIAGQGRVSDLLDLNAVGGEGLLIGGEFIITGGVVSASIAEFRFQPAIFSDGFESGDASAWIQVP